MRFETSETAICDIDIAVVILGEKTLITNKKPLEARSPTRQKDKKSEKGLEKPLASSSRHSYRHAPWLLPPVRYMPPGGPARSMMDRSPI